VQFTAAVSNDATLPLGGAVVAVLHAQNCVEAPRTLVVSLEGQTDAIAGDLVHRFEIGPGQVVRVEVPFKVRRLSNSVLHFALKIEAHGQQAGRRLRLDQGATWVTPSTQALTNVVGAATLAFAGLGVFQLGSNGGIHVRVDADLPPVEETPRASCAVLFTPGAAQLETAARG
jgi:hypothetical protein